MQRVVLLMVFIFMMSAAAHGADNTMQRNIEWLVDSYNYGKDGNDCLNIYINYGTPKWTFNSDDPTLLQKFYEACKVGEKDRVSGRNSLPQVMNTFRRQH